MLFFETWPVELLPEPTVSQGGPCALNGCKLVVVELFYVLLSGAFHKAGIAFNSSVTIFHTRKLFS